MYACKSCSGSAASRSRSPKAQAHGLRNGGNPCFPPAEARKHLKGGCLVLYDVSSSYVEGRCCELAKRGYNRDGRRGKLQIVYGLLCAADGCPVAVEVFEGNTGDPKTLAAQIGKLKQRFKLDRAIAAYEAGESGASRVRIYPPRHAN